MTAATISTIDLLRVATAGPGDLTATDALTAAGYTNDDVLAVVGKTEGNGCVNDFSRTLAATRWEQVLPSGTVTVFSGGTEGVLSPHVNLIVADSRPHQGYDRGLVGAVGRTRDLSPAEVGRQPQLTAVREVVTELTVRLGLAPDEVDLVLVKCPLLTSERIAACRAAGSEPVTEDTYESMARSRAASALGIALALDECTEPQALGALAGQDGDDPVWSSRASASAGAELTDCHVLVLGTSRAARGPLRAVHGTMRDAIDLAALTRLFDQVRADGGEVVQVFAKAEADPSGTVRGARHTMLTDSDIHSTRHARSAVGGLLAALAGHTALYVSGGAEHQGAPGGGSVTVVYRVPPTRG